jgi:hypothetical protein
MKPTSRPVLFAMLSAAMVTAEFVGGKATREALFLTSLGFQALPAMLIAASASTLLLVAAHARWGARLAPSALLQILFAASGVLFLCEWLIRFSAPAASAVLLFLHTSAMAPLLGSGFWLITTELFDPRTARRRFGQITGASTFGGLMGALVSERVAATWGAPAMLLVLGGVQLLTVFLCSRFAACARNAVDREDMGALPAAAVTRSGLRLIAEAPHLRHLVVFVLLGSASAALLDYLFKARAVEAIGTGDELLRFLALYYAAINVATFIFQSASSRIALERFGLGLTTSTPSIAVLAGAVGGLVAPGFGSLTAARAAEAIFKTSWFRAGYELFYTPIPAAEKRSVKSIVDVGVERLGEAVGGGLVRAIVFVAPAAQSSAILWVAIGTATAAIIAASRLNYWYVRTLGTSLVSQAPGLVPSDTAGHLTRRMLLKVQGSPRPSALNAPDDMDDVRALRSGDKGSVTEVLAREEGLSAALVAHAIPLLDGPLSDYALFALRKVSEERVGQLTDALLDPNQDDVIRQQLARVFSVAVSQRAADGLLLALDDKRFEVRYQAARSLGLIFTRNPRILISRERILDIVVREVALGRPVWESRSQLDKSFKESPLEEFVRDRAGQSLAHVFTLLSLILPSQPLHIAFRSLHSRDSRLRGTALEYLEGVLPAELRQQLWPFLVQGDAVRPPHQPLQVVAASS